MAADFDNPTALAVKNRAAESGVTSQNAGDVSKS
jgi:hypothetical protein